MHRAAVGAVEPSETSLWLCASCNACSERCPSRADPATVIALLREESASAGNLPPYLQEEAKRYLETGLCFPRTGMTKKMRRELGLDDGAPSSQAVEEAREIARRTGLGRMGVE